MTIGNGRHGSPASVSGETNEQEERRVVVAKLLKRRYTHQEIADQLGCSRPLVTKDVKLIRQAWREDYTAEYGDHAAEQLAALAEIEQKLLPRVLEGGKDGGMDLWALDRYFTLLERKARLLGLDAPQRIEVTMHVERVAKALEVVVVAMGLDAEQVRPLLGQALREQTAITEGDGE